jgi:hypothetical protein
MTELRASLPPIEIRPEVTVLSVLRHLNYKPWFAIAEFIDNALQSAISEREQLVSIHGEKYQLTVNVDIDSTAPGQITIVDNAGGISVTDFPRAFRAAQIPADRSGLSEFGMGMKSAACWFAETWSVRTKAIGESVERSIFFDVKHIVENKIESLGTEIREVNSSSHYTVVTLRGLHHLPQGRTIGKIKDHLASIYRNFIRDGRLVLLFNREPLVYRSPAVLKAPRYVVPGVVDPSDQSPIEWLKKIDLDFGEGQRVTGFAALREVGSTPLAGFALFRRDRLIVGSHDETYRPALIFKHANSYPFQRLFGELHVEGFEVSHTKDGFRWEAYEDEFLDCLADELEKDPIDLLTQAENYRALPSKKSIEVRATVATLAVAEYLAQEIAPLLVESKQHPASPAELPETILASDLQASERIVTLADGTYTWIVTLRTSIDPARNDWVALAKQEQQNDDTDRTRRLILDLSLAHPFSAEFIGADNENIELFLRIAAAICIALVLSEDTTGDPPQDTLFHLNYLLRGAIARMDLANVDNDHNPQIDQAEAALGT